MCLYLCVFPAPYLPPLSPPPDVDEDGRPAPTGTMKGLPGGRGLQHPQLLPSLHSPCGPLEFERAHDFHGVHPADLRHAYLPRPRPSPRSSAHSDCAVTTPAGELVSSSSSTFPRMHYGSPYYEASTISTSAPPLAPPHPAITTGNHTKRGFHTLQYQRASCAEPRGESPGRIRTLVHSVQKLFTKSHSLESKTNGATHHPARPGSRRAKSKERRPRPTAWWTSDEALDSARHHVRDHGGDYSLKTSRSSNDVKCSACEVGVAAPPEAMKRSSWSTLTVSQAKEAYRKSSLHLERASSLRPGPSYLQVSTGEGAASLLVR